MITKLVFVMPPGFVTREKLITPLIQMSARERIFILYSSSWSTCKLSFVNRGRIKASFYCCCFAQFIPYRIWPPSFCSLLCFISRSIGPIICPRLSMTATLHGGSFQEAASFQRQGASKQGRCTSITLGPQCSHIGPVVGAPHLS